MSQNAGGAGFDRRPRRPTASVPFPRKCGALSISLHNIFCKKQYFPIRPICDIMRMAHVLYLLSGNHSDQGRIHMKSLMRRILALSLALVLALSLVPTVFAAGSGAGTAGSEYGRHGLGLLPAQRHGGTDPSDGTLSVQELETDDLPASYDSRTYGYITPVRDQGDHNTCWTFGAAASCEAYMIKHGVHVGENGAAADQSLNLSEYHLAYYTYADAYDAEGMLTGDKTYFLSSHANGSFLEAGGTGELVSYPLMRWTGLADESDIALMYSSANSGGLGSEHAYQDNVAHVTSVKHFFGSNVDEVKRHIMAYGAGSMGVRVSNASGTAYHGGVNTSNGTICWIQSAVAYQDTGFYYADHDVTVVGWDDDFAKENFNQGYRPTSDGAWIVKNSWGTGTGDDGYFYVSYEDSATCASYISFFAVEDVDNYDHNYQYDGSGNYYNSQEMTTGDSIAQVFTANGSETLEAVALALYGDNTDYTVQVYTGCAVDDPSSGTLAATQTGNFDYWGYQTIKLDDPVALTPGQRFAIVISFSGSDINVAYDTTIQEDTYYHVGLIHMTHPNTSYCKGVNDSGWTNKSGDGNYRVKAFTRDVPEDPVPMDLQCIALGSVYETISGTAGDKITLPSAAPAADGWLFLGWVAAPLAETAEKPSFYQPGATFKLTASIPAVYALYSRAEAIDAPVTYELVTSMPGTWEGKYVLVATPTTGSTEYVLTGMSAGAEGVNIENSSTGASTLFTSTGITRSGTTLSTMPDAYVFAVEPTGYGLSLQSVSDGSYYGSKSTGSGSASYALYAFPAFQESNTTWTFEIDDDEMYLKSNSAGSIPYVAVSGSWGFSLTRYGSEFKFYKQNPTENYYYATEIGSVPHTHTLTHMAAKAPTCAAAGNIEYWFCAPCGKYFSDAAAEHEIAQADTVLPATGNHSYDAWSANNNGTHSHTCATCGDTVTENCTYTDVVTAPTETSQGYTTHTCNVCGYSFVDSYVDALGYTVRFSVPAGVTTIDDMNCQAGASIMLPAAGAPEGYTFLGWVTEDVDHVSSMPAVLTGSYAATADITLKALYSHTDTVAAGYQLVTEAPADWNGSYVITYGKTDTMTVLKGVAGTRKLESATAGAAAAFDTTGMTLNGTVLNNVSEAYVFTITANDGKAAIRSVSSGTFLANRGGYLYSYKALSARYCLWTLSMKDGTVDAANLASKTRSHLGFSPRNCFMIDRSANDGICFWKMGGTTSTTIYTTIIG